MSFAAILAHNWGGDIRETWSERTINSLNRIFSFGQAKGHGGMWGRHKPHRTTKNRRNLFNLSLDLVSFGFLAVPDPGHRGGGLWGVEDKCPPAQPYAADCLGLKHNRKRYRLTSSTQIRPTSATCTVSHEGRFGSLPHKFATMLAVFWASTTIAALSPPLNSDTAPQCMETARLEAIYEVALAAVIFYFSGNKTHIPRKLVVHPQKI